MGFFSKVKKGFKKVGKAIKKGVNKAADAVADAVKSVGNAVGDALSWLGKKIPGVGGVFGWLGDVVSSAFDLVGSVIKAAGAIVGGVLGGVVRIVGGILTLDGDEILAGLSDIASGVAGGVIVVLAKAWAFVQVVFTVGRPRPLNQTESAIVKLVFHDAIATYNVRVVDGNAGLYSLNDRPFVVGDTIYMKDHDAATEPGVFAHECVHVWQNQHLGSEYVADALASQWWGAEYVWEDEASEDEDWIAFEREAQGAFIEEVYDEGGTASSPSAGMGAFFAESDPSLRSFTPTVDGTVVDYTALANAATRTIRGETPWRLSEIRD